MKRTQDSILSVFCSFLWLDNFVLRLTDPECVSFVFWEKLRLNNFVSRLTDLSKSSVWLMLLCPNGPKTSLNQFKKADNSCFEFKFDDSDFPHNIRIRLAQLKILFVVS